MTQDLVKEACYGPRQRRPATQFTLVMKCLDNKFDEIETLLCEPTCLHSDCRSNTDAYLKDTHSAL